jgi:hypothetical protein
MLYIDDLLVMNDLYYVGHIIDLDGSEWVDTAHAELILLEFNAGVV